MQDGMRDGGDRVELRRLPRVMGGLEVLRADFRRSSFAPHFHDDYTVGLITRGANRFRYRRQRVVAPLGTLCLADPGEVHTGDVQEGGWSYWSVHIPPSALAALAAELDGPGDTAPDFATGVIDDAEAVRRFAAFFQALHAAAPALAVEVRAVEALAHLIGRHAAHHPARPPAAGDAALARRARDLLAARAAEPVSLAELEAATGAGRYRLIRAFRAAYGMPPCAWQTQRRLITARALIGAGQPIADAAAATGFADQAHLTRLFKRSFGYTPGAFLRVWGMAAPSS
ncbi:AraC family transcriptional regulator [Azospirillum sp.]|uniref:helix-turn-helix transcriptional regulator n=1 Tax=Azospirillum sp. TaxID=34012 RepID=UPI002D598885|nr:AraC family transcriptional regulator [Azospirillum sp.]HYD65048.1 AraC family transcriptional regulator [Azospirillum sp.]